MSIPLVEATAFTKGIFMSLKSFLLLLSIFSLGLTYAQDELEALFGSQESSKTSKDLTPPKVDSKTSSFETSKVCSDKDQTSLPLRYLLGLFREKGTELSVTHDPSSGILNVKGGTMIGNCHSMLDFQISEPDGELPYRLEAKIKKNCDSSTCNYKVIKGGEEVELPFSPTLTGFKECLKATGVINESGKVEKDKIALVDFNITKKDVFESGELWFASHGPEALKVKGVYSKENKKTGDGCYYYEDPIKNGFKIYSEEETSYNRAKSEFEALCNVTNYKVIDGKIEQFNEFKEFQGMLVGIRNKLIEDEVKALAATLKTTKDYSDLDITVLKDFHEKIIEPLKFEIVEKFKEYLQESGDVKFQKERELKALQDELLKYSKTPYLDSLALKNLQDSEGKNAPLHLDSWYTNVLSLNKSLNTIASYQNLKGTNSEGKKRSPLTQDKEINDKQAIFARSLADVRYKHEIRNNIVEGNPSESYYQRKEELLQNVRNRNEELNRLVSEELQYIQSYCYNPNNYWLNRQQCVQESQENIMVWKERVQKMNQRDLEEAQRQGAKGDEFRVVEAKRDGRSNSRKTSSESEMVFDFTNPRSTQTQNSQFQYNWQNQGYQNPWMNFNQQQPWGGYQTQQPWGYGQNSWGGNFSIGAGAGYQNGYFGMPQQSFGGYGQYPYMNNTGYFFR